MAPAFVQRSAGTIINIAAVVGVAVDLLNGVYGASKAYVIAFGHTLQRDLVGKGVRIQTVMPGATATEFRDVPGYALQKESATTTQMIKTPYAPSNFKPLGLVSKTSIAAITRKADSRSGR